MNSIELDSLIGFGTAIGAVVLLLSVWARQQAAHRLRTRRLRKRFAPARARRRRPF